MMSDSESSSDSDFIRHWTILGRESSADGSDPDSDIVVLKLDDDLAVHMEPVDGLQNSNEETDVCGREASCTAQSLEPVEEAKLLENWTTEPQSKMSKSKPTFKVDEETKDKAKDEMARMSMESGARDASASMELLESCLPVQDKGGLFDTKMFDCEENEPAEEGNFPERLDFVSSCHVLNSSSSSSSSGLHSDTSVEQKFKIEADSVPSGDTSSDAENDDEDDDDYEDDDDESVVRKFHRVSLYRSLNRQPPSVIHVANQLNNEDDEIIPPDVDDRCESDISGVADDDDDDLSSQHGIDDLLLDPGDVVRSYRHQPNPTVNTRLTLIALMTLLFALGIGIGHYVGSSWESTFYQLNMVRLQSMQDEYFMCLRNMEKLESKLATDSDPKEKLMAVLAVWKRKYEELVLERAELEYKLNHLQDKLERDHDREGPANDGFQSCEFQDSKDSLYKKEIMAFKEEVTECRQSLNLLKLGLDEKRAEVDHLKNDANRLVFENTDLKSAILNQRYTEHPGNVKSTEQSEQAVESEKQEQFMEMENHLVEDNGEQHGYISPDIADAAQPAASSIEQKLITISLQGDDGVSEKNSVGTENQENSTGVENKAKNVVGIENLKENVVGAQKCMKNSVGTENQGKSGKLWSNSFATSLLNVLITSAVQRPDLRHMALYHNSFNTFVDCFTTLENVTVSSRPDDLPLPNTWDQIDLTFKRLLETLMPAQLEKVLHSCHDFINFEKWNSDSEETKEIPVKLDQRGSSQSDAKLLQDVVKKLSDSVKGLLRSSNSMKQELLPGHLAKQEVQNFIKHWSHKVLSGWKKIEGYLHKADRKEVSSNSKRKESFKKPTEYEDSFIRTTERKESFGQQKEYEGILNEEHVVESIGRPKQTFEGNRDRKQTESYQKNYEEFWKWNHFDPDDFLQEGFFEDNQREWHKHQKRLRKVNGRIQRLTEEMLLSMDDDDVEDIYEEMDDLVDDLEDREIPEQLWKWMTCQLRWWRSRVYRKHRNEDLVKGCGRQLMHWQLRVICKERRDRWNDRGKAGLHLPDLCKTVISTQGMESGAEFRFSAKEKPASGQGFIFKHLNINKNNGNYLPTSEKPSQPEPSKSTQEVTTFDRSVKETVSAVWEVENDTSSISGAYNEFMMFIQKGQGCINTSLGTDIDHGLVPWHDSSWFLGAVTARPSVKTQATDAETVNCRRKEDFIEYLLQQQEPNCRK